jgi:hypothetical protein
MYVHEEQVIKEFLQLILFMGLDDESCPCNGTSKEVCEWPS